jgi:hydroxymethylglutaryl-CoA lyase
MTARLVQLVEVGPRDGLQNEAVQFSTSQKLEFIRRSSAAGIRKIEVASFVNPRRVPQMADADAIFANLPSDAAAVHVGLVLNKRGLDRALAAGCKEVGFVLVASDTFSRRNQGMSTAEAVDIWHEISAEATANGVKASVTIAAAFGCPFEGEVALSRVIELTREIMKSPPLELAVADTIGVGVPPQVSAMIEQLLPVVKYVPLRMHFHNTRNTAIANIAAAVQAGVAIIDASTGGIGGCPFAPNATGNVATEDVLYLLHRMDIETGVSLDSVIDTARWLELQLGRPVPGVLAKVQKFPTSNSGHVA